uniref:Uncharacterized protein n=1 Tax=Rhizophora mucronata TaxID=61149 RepID=A0A2P2QE79_RHIMU
MYLLLKLEGLCAISSQDLFYVW